MQCMIDGAPSERGIQNGQGEREVRRAASIVLDRVVREALWFMRRWHLSSDLEQVKGGAIYLQELHFRPKEQKEQRP